MNPNSPFHFLVSASLLASGLVLAPSLKAGPGLDYWARQSAARTHAASSEPAREPARVCRDSHLVETTVTKNAWVNGRGPTQTAATVSKRICTACAEPAVVMKHAWANGKGPMVTSTARAAHDCQTCGGEHG